jgi:N-acetyl-gamma-glutamyl-phosphate reductase
MAVRVGIAGVSGYAGVDALRLLLAHPHAQIAALAGGGSAGGAVADSWGALAGLDLPPIVPLEGAGFGEGLDAVLLALPHGVSGGWVARHRHLLDQGVVIIDLGADFRLRDPAQHAAVYGAPHAASELLPRAVYGLPELHREQLRGARLIANPGCYPTATALAALPLVEAGLATFLVSDCVSGVSGAGRKAGPRNLYCEVHESVVGYGLGGSHRHAPEIEQILGRQAIFTPHLVPMSRGMLATVTCGLSRMVTAAELRAAYAERYAGHPAVVLRDEPPATADVRGTGMAHVFVTVDPARGVAQAQCAIDNLGKGAAAQAVQNLNLALGLPEMAGVVRVPLLP